MPVDDAVEVILDALLVSILTACVCEKVPGGGIPARNRRSSAAKCVVQIDFAENNTCGSDSIHTKKKKKKKLYLTPNRQMYNASHYHKITAIYTHAHTWTHVHKHSS